MPPDLNALLWKHYTTFCNYARSLKDQSALKVFVITAFSVFFWFGLYSVFFAGFRFLNSFTDVLDLVISLLFALFYLTLSVMLIMSNGILLFSSLYHSEESSFLINKPIRPGSLFFYFFLLCLFFSSWAFLFLGTPLMLAYGIVKQVELSFYPCVFLYFCVFMLIPAAISAILVILVPFLVPKLSLKKVLFLVLGVILVTTIYFLPQFQTLNNAEKYTEQWLTSIFDKLSFTRSVYLPSFWITRGTLALANQNWSEFLYNFMLLLSNALMLLLIAYQLFEYLYFLAFQKVASSHSKKLYLKHQDFLEKSILKLPFISFGSRVLILKDMRHFLRDPLQWSQFLILFGLLGFYILNLRTLAYDGRDFFWKNLIAFLNLGATALCLSTYASRFIYPLISLEGKRFWILGVSPLSRRKLILSKFYFSFFSLLCISELLVFSSCFMLKVPWTLTLLQAVTCVLLSAGISGLTVGLSAIYINLKDSNPAKIVSGFGGTLNLVLALIYLFSVTFSEGIASYLFHETALMPYSRLYWMRQFITPTQLLLGTCSFVLCLTFLYCVVPLYLGIKKFERMQF